MILVGDAGGNKTDWRLQDGKNIVQFSQGGFNAVTHDLSSFVRQCEITFSDQKDNISQVFLYAAGITDQSKPVIEENLSEVFSTGQITVENDLLGASRSLFEDKKGRIGILGTGAGYCEYDGHQITKRIPSLGYIIGDEGSGSYLGKKLLRTYFRGELNKELSSLFSRAYGSREDEILNAVYAAQGNTYLSSFSQFIIEHQSKPEIYHLVYQAFQDYFDSFVKTNSEIRTPLRFTGSIAYFLGNILRKVGVDNGINIDLISQSPIAGLALYHFENE